MYARLLIALSFAPAAALADPPRIEDASALRQGSQWIVSVTLSHPDTGWVHYADGWRVLDMQGNEIGLRVLLHPHETEQPFTRSLSGVAIPEGTAAVQIEARCLVDGWTGQRRVLTLP